MNAPELTVLERGWLSSNNILIGDGPDNAVLVDTGYGSHSAQTVALVHAALNGRQLTQIINTHLHSDHCGGNAALVRAFAAPLLIPPGQFEAALHWDSARLSFDATGQHCERFQPKGQLLPGSTLHIGAGLWHVLAAPGHDPDSVILFESHSGTLISADALWQQGFGIVFPEIDDMGGFDEVEATLDLIASLPVARVIPGHGPAFNDVAQALSQARRRLQGFRQDPARHARYAAKALLKFHMLEVQQQSLLDLLSWLEATAVQRALWSRHFSQQSPHDWHQALLDELTASGALRLEGGQVHNA